MKLQDALRKTIREFGLSSLKDRRLVSILSDYHAFTDYPAMRQVMATLAEKGYGKELFRLSNDGNLEKAATYARNLTKSLSKDLGFREEFANYASDCIIFALGLAVTIREPSDHGFDPMGNQPGPVGRTNSVSDRKEESLRSTSSESEKEESWAPSGSEQSHVLEKTPVGEPIPIVEKVKFCNICGAPLPEGSRFCPKCGAESAHLQSHPQGSKDSSAGAGTHAGRRYRMVSLAGWFSLKGRMARREWWLRSLILFLISFAFTLVIGMLDDKSGNLGNIGTVLFIATIVTVSVSSYMISARRLHDLNHSGWWVLAVIAASVIFLPLVLAFYVWLGFFRGTNGQNRFGPDPV